MILDLERFLAVERPYWHELENALHPYERDRLYRPSYDEAVRLFELYQRTTADLSRIQEAAQPVLARYLEGLVARTYAQIYTTHRRSSWRPLHFLLTTFPQTLRRQWRSLAFATAILIIGAAVGASLIVIDKDAKRVLMPFPHLMNDPNERVKEEEREHGHHVAGQQVAFSAYLMTHNIGVSFTSMAAGMTFGIGTFLLVLTNGIDLGAIALDYVRAGQSRFLLAWLLPHGVFEIPALLIASQAGFLIASALIGWHSRLSRSQRLRRIMPDVFTLCAGSGAMLIWAGLIESFVSQYHEPVLPYWVKITFAAIEVVVLCWFFLRAGLEQENKDSVTAPGDTVEI